MVDKTVQRQEALPEHLVAVGRAGRPRRVRELDDPIAMGVHPAAVLERVESERTVTDRVPPYISRDIDEQLRAAITRKGFVLLTGDSTAGKTRAAYEAVRAVLPDHVLFAPASRESVTTILPMVLEQRCCVVWLDDLERFVGSGGFTANTLVRMLGKGERRVVVLATMRSAEFDRYSIREQASLNGPQRELWRAGRDVIELALVISLSRPWSPAELNRAQNCCDDPRIRAALGQTNRFGLAEVLAAGPELAQDWHNAWRHGGHPRGAALVAAAVDCRRAGLHTPIPIGVLTELAEHYLAERQGTLMRPESLTDALTWATTNSHGTSSLLLPTTQAGCYLAFDYLIDLPGLGAIPQVTWDTLIKSVAPQQAFDIGQAAGENFQSSVAVAAYQKAAYGHVADADIALANAVGLNGDPFGARQLLLNLLRDREREVGPNSLVTFRIRRHLATHTWHCGALSHAVESIEQLVSDQQEGLGPDHPETLASRWWLACMIGEAGDPRRAIELLSGVLTDRVRVLGPDHHDTLHTHGALARWIAEAGHPQSAIQLFTDVCAYRERVLGVDHPDTLRARHSIAEWVGETGESAQAAALFRRLAEDRERILGRNHHHTLYARCCLIHFMAKAGDRAYATQLFTVLLDDWKGALGHHNPGAFLAHDCNLGVVGQPPPNTPFGRRRLSEFLWTCQHLLGPDHHLTTETQQLLSNLSPPN
jgi:hypothetical protein